MSFSKHIISALIAASTVYGAIPCSGGSASVQNQGDADAVAACGEKYDGDVEILNGAGATLDFGRLQTITGTVSMDSDDLIASLKLSSLQTLGGLRLTNLTSLATLDLSSLTNVRELTLENLGVLSAINLGTGLSRAGDITIENVQLTDLSGISSASKVDSVVLANCQHLSNITFSFKDVGVVDIGPNNYVQGQQLSFPQLETATSLFLRNSTLINTPKLKNVSDTLGLYGNLFTTYSAPTLIAVGALVLEDNSKVTNFSFPSLVHINGANSTLDIENNTALVTVDGFPKLVDITSGDAIFAGNIRNISLPSLTSIAGALNVDTTSPDFNCDSINALGGGKVAQGNVFCTRGDSTPVGSGGNNTSGSSSSSRSSSAAVPTELPAFLTTGLFAALLAFLA